MAKQTGGYDYEFIEAPSDNLICKICQCPSKEPHLNLCCGHTFCKSCLEAAKRAESISISSACPMCRSEDFVTVFNKQTDRDIKNLQVYCSNKEKGCEWQGELNAITGHLTKKDGCQFQKVNCPNKCKVACQRRDLTNHVETECPCRKVSCQYCHDIGEYQFIKGQHKQECSKVPLSCPNNCEIGTILREDIEKHKCECPLEVISCFKNCGTNLKRRHLSYHVKTECPHRKVNCEYCHYTGEHQFIEGQHKEECLKFPQPCPYKCGIGSIPRDELTKHTDRCSLEDIQCKYHIVGCEAILARKDHEEHNKKMVEQHLSLSLSELAATKTSVKNFREHLLVTSQHHVQEITHDLTEKVAIIENKVFTFKQFTNSQSEQNAEMKTVSHEVAVIKQKIAEVSGKVTDQIKNSVMETKKSFMQSLMFVKKDIKKQKEEMEKYHEELEVVKQELQATKEQTRSKNICNTIIPLMLIITLMFLFYINFGKLQSLEHELTTKISELEIQCKIAEVKKDQTIQNLILQLQRLEEKCNSTTLQTDGILKNNILVAKLQEDINAVNKTVLEGISAVNKTVLEGISAVNRTVLEGISAVNKTVLEGISAVNKTVLEGISAVNKTALEGISAVNKTVLEGISAVNKTALEGISAVNKTVLEGISAVNKTVLEGISAVNTTALEGISAVNKTALEGISAVNRTVLEGISAVNKTALEGISAVNKTALEGISAVNRTVLEGISAVNKTVLEGISAVNRTVLEGISAVNRTVLEGISAVNKTALEGISAVNKTALEGISAVNRTVLEGISAVNKTVLEGISAVNKTVLEGISAVNRTVLEGISAVNRTVLEGISAVNKTVLEGISAVNKTVLEGISAVNKTVLEGISAVNRTVLEGINTVNKTALEGISAVNKTALEGISDLKAQLPFLYCSFSYPSFYDELITKADRSQFNSSNAPVIVKISGISDALGSSCRFYQEVYVANLYGDTIKLLLYKYNNTHMLIRLYNQECSIHKYQVWFNLFTVRLMNQVTDSHHYKLNLLSEDFWMSDEIQTTVHCSLNQLFSFGSIYKMTRSTQYIGCDSAFFSVDHPDFYKWF